MHKRVSTTGRLPDLAVYNVRTASPNAPEHGVCLSVTDQLRQYYEDNVPAASDRPMTSPTKFWKRCHAANTRRAAQRRERTGTAVFSNGPHKPCLEDAKHNIRRK
jgi:hypothetical protein